MSADMMKIVASLKSQIAALETMIAAASSEGPKKRGRPAKAVEEKPKKDMSAGMKAWHDFNARIDSLLKAAETPFKRVAEAKQFASKLKKEKAVANWTDEEILSACAEWVEEHKPVCPVCHEDATGAPAAHGECVKTFSREFHDTGKGTKEEGLAEWSKVCGLAKVIAERQAEEAPAKKAGRPKMTDEEKAAKKAARAAMAPEEKAAKKAPKPKVAWGAAASAVIGEDCTVTVVE